MSLTTECKGTFSLTTGCADVRFDSRLHVSVSAFPELVGEWYELIVELIINNNSVFLDGLLLNWMASNARVVDSPALQYVLYLSNSELQHLCALLGSHELVTLVLNSVTEFVNETVLAVPAVEDTATETGITPSAALFIFDTARALP